LPKFVLLSGNSRTRFPVAAKIALQMAGDIGGTPGGTVNTISSLVVSAVGGSGNDLLMGNSKPARLRQSRFLGDPRFCQLPECMAAHLQLSRSHPAS